jgi:hypothetical protein
MRQLCPYCGQLVDLPAEAAGKETPCPACAKPFAVPLAYTPSVSNPPPVVEEKPASAAIPSPLGDQRECSLTLSPRIVAWVPAISLTVALVSVLFFSWVGSFPAGERVFAQSPLQALFATFNRTTLASMQDAEKGLEAHIQANLLMLPFLLGLVAATALAWFERVFPHPTVQTLPAFLFWMMGVWPRRFLILISLTAFCLAAILVQCWRGFGLETAARDYATAQVRAKQTEPADTSFKKQAEQIQIGQEYGKFCLSDTLASGIGVTALVLALASLLVYWWLDHRGDKPAPQFILRH